MTDSIIPHTPNIEGETLPPPVSAVGDATSLKNDTKSPVGDATSPIGDATSPKNDATSPIGDATSPIGDATSAEDNTKSPVGDATSPKNDPKSPKNDTKSAVGDATSLKNDTKSPVGDATSPKNDPKSAKVDPKSLEDDATSAVGDAKSKSAKVDPKSAKQNRKAAEQAAASQEDQRLKALREAKEQAAQDTETRTRSWKVLLNKIAKETVTVFDLPTLMQHASELSPEDRGLVVAQASKLILEGIAANEKLQETNKELQKANRELEKTKTRLTGDLDETRQLYAEKKAELKEIRRAGALQQQTCAALTQQVEALTEKLKPLREENAQLTTLLSAKDAALDEANAAADSAKAAADAAKAVADAAKAAANAAKAAADAATAAKVPNARSVEEYIELAIGQVDLDFSKRVEDTTKEVAALTAQMLEATKEGRLIDMKAIFEKLGIATEDQTLAIAAHRHLNSMLPERKDKLVGVAAANLKMNAAGIKKKASESNAPAPEQSAAKEPMSFASVANGTWPSLSDQHTAKAKASSGNASPLIGKANDKGFTVGNLVQVDNKAQGPTTSVTVTFPGRPELYKFFTQKHQSSDDNSKTSAAAEFQTFCKTHVWPKLSEPNNKAIIDQVNVKRDRLGYDEITETTVYFCSGSLTAESVTIYLNYNRNKSSTKH